MPLGMYFLNFSFCFFVAGFCGPCWYLWHAKGTLQQHHQISVVSEANKRSKEPQIHEEIPVINKVKWKPPHAENRSVSKEVFASEKLIIS